MQDAHPKNSQAELKEGKLTFLNRSFRSIRSIQILGQGISCLVRFETDDVYGVEKGLYGQPTRYNVNIFIRP